MSETQTHEHEIPALEEIEQHAQHEEQLSFAERARAFMQERFQILSETTRRLTREGRERAESMVGRTVHESKVAYHGLAASVAERQMERAGSKMEHRDHKLALYTDLGMLALEGRRPTTLIQPEDPDAEPIEYVGTRDRTGEAAQPRSAFERFLAKRLDKQMQKHEDAMFLKRRAVRVHGYKYSIDRPTDANRKAKVRSINRQVRKGQITHTEARHAKSSIMGKTRNHGLGMHEHADRTVRRSKKNMNATMKILNPAVQQEKASNAEGSIRNHWERMQSHKQAQEELRRSARNIESSNVTIDELERQDYDLAREWLGLQPVEPSEQVNRAEYDRIMGLLDERENPDNN